MCENQEILVSNATFTFPWWNVTIHLYFSSCELDMFKFPFDSQKCYLDFGNTVELDSMVNITTELNLAPYSGFNSEFNESFGNMTELSSLMNVTTEPTLGLSLEFYSESNEFYLKSTEVSSSMWTVSMMLRF